MKQILKTAKAFRILNINGNSEHGLHGPIMTFWPRLTTSFITLKTSLLFILCVHFLSPTVSILYGTHHV